MEFVARYTCGHDSVERTFSQLDHSEHWIQIAHRDARRANGRTFDGGGVWLDGTCVAIVDASGAVTRTETERVRGERVGAVVDGAPVVGALPYVLRQAERADVTTDVAMADGIVVGTSASRAERMRRHDLASVKAMVRGKRDARRTPNGRDWRDEHDPNGKRASAKRARMERKRNVQVVRNLPTVEATPVRVVDFAQVVAHEERKRERMNARRVFAPSAETLQK